MAKCAIRACFRWGAGGWGYRTPSSILRLFRPAPGPLRGLSCGSRDEDNRPVGLGFAAAGYPGDPVRTARFGVNLVGARGHGVSKVADLRPISCSRAISARFLVAPAGNPHIKSDFMPSPGAAEGGTGFDVDLSKLRQRPEFSGQDAANARRAPRRWPRRGFRREPAGGARSALR